jgi:hypothetical protein
MYFNDKKTVVSQGHRKKDSDKNSILEQSRLAQARRIQAKLETESATIMQKYLRSNLEAKQNIKELVESESIAVKLKEVATIAEFLSVKNDKRLASVLKLALNKQNLLIKINLVLTSLRKVGVQAYNQSDNLLVNALRLIGVMKQDVILEMG